MLDQLDRDIITHLRADPLTTNKAVAAELGVAESTIGARIRSLSERNIMRVVAMRDIRALGYDLLAHVDVVVEGRDPSKVAEELSGIPEISAVVLYPGAPQIMLTMLARDRTELVSTISTRLAPIRGIYSFKTVISLKILKYLPEYAGNMEAPPVEFDRDESADVLHRIMQIVERDARVANREIARMIGVSEASVRKRLKKQIDTGAMKLAAVTDPQALGLDCAAILRLSVKPSFVDDVAGALTSWPELQFVSITTGAFDVMGVATVSDTDSLAELAHARIAVLKGVTFVDVRELSAVAKMRYNLVRILPAG
ncbi:MAG: Lrp/AsnC family transcriptional regulator [Parasphingopyxis sp.]|uniref:Lrp/AsnC family transcriptional regulator n=1 Tax=Parasphingopyxis sp. TaxID=1920299 RepID=UPI003F9FBF0B